MRLFALAAFAALLAATAPHLVASESAVEFDRATRAQINIQNWDDGGEISHWTYLHTSEVFPVAAVRRAGPVRELPVHLRPEIGDFPLSQKDGTKRRLQDYIAGSDMDGSNNWWSIAANCTIGAEYPHRSYSRKTSQIEGGGWNRRLIIWRYSRRTTPRSHLPGLIRQRRFIRR